MALREDVAEKKVKTEADQTIVRRTMIHFNTVKSQTWLLSLSGHQSLTLI